MFAYAGDTWNLLMIMYERFVSTVRSGQGVGVQAGVGGRGGHRGVCRED